MYAGGGSTDIRLSNGTWNDFNSLKTRFMVAAGGGGASTYHTLKSGGYAGGLIGGSYDTQLAYDGNSVENSGGTQTKGGINGGGTNSGITAGSIAGFGVPTEGTNGGGFGGNGYYAGGQGGHSRGTVGTGSGGSSFISGHTGCNAITSSSTSSNIIHTGQPNHYSGYVFSNTVMKAGNEVMPSPTGGTETGHSGNGYCKITWHPAL